MKRYLLFSGDYCYPDGGWNDYNSSYDEREVAIKARDNIKKNGMLWAHVVDTKHMEIVK